MKVSVIIPTFNEEKNIRDCLESLSNQSYKDLEIIVVDDGSTDKTVDKLIVETLLKQEHLGAGAARNLGARHAKGEILVFVDADMTFDKNFIEKLIEPIVKGETIGTFSKDEYLANKDNVWARCWNINRGLSQTKMHTDHYPDKQKVFRAILTKEFGKAGGFDERAGYVDDWSLSDKLGVEATSATGAIFYHKNPETLSEVFVQSKWMAKRKYKLGYLGFLIALVRVSFPVSIILGIVIGIKENIFEYIVFKVVSDFGQFVGVLEYSLGGKVFK